MSDFRPMESRSSALIQNYGFVILFVLIIGGAAYGSGDQPSLIALKMLMAPLYILANRGLRTYFYDPIVEPFWTARSVEYTLLQAAVFSGFLTLVLWQPSRDLNTVLMDFGRGFAIMGAAMLLGLRWRIRDLQKGMPSQ
jgi:hypothetical protein